jgi:hypothetical protein
VHGERDRVVHRLSRRWQRLMEAAASFWRRGQPTTSPATLQGDDASPAPAPEASTSPNQAATGGQVTATDGYITVRDGQVQITNPMGGGLLPVLVPGSDVVLTVDGHEITHPVSVWAGQRVTVRPRLPAEPVRRFQIEVEPDGMAAWLILPALGPPGYRVLDAGPSHVVRLVAEVLPGYQASPTMEDIEQGLAAAGVVAGIDRNAISQALKGSGPTKVKVAAGQPVLPSQPGRIESAAPDPADPLALTARVHPGQSLARVIPPKVGQTGYDVRGRVLEPEPVQEMRLVAGAGTVLTQGGTEAVAAMAGRPALVELEPGVSQISVVPVTELSGPLTPGSVPYQFEGDVIIAGDVCEGVTLRAGGWIWVHGSVEGAHLQAGQGIRVDRTVQRSRLVTRSARRMIVPFRQQYGRILTDLEQMQAFAVQIIQHPRYAELSRAKSFGQVMLLLARNRFGSLRQSIQQGRQMLMDLAFLRTQVDLEAVLNTLEERVYSGNLNAVDDLTQIIEGIRAATQRVTEALGAGGVEAPVHAHTLIMSQVDADGEVVVHGPGAEQSAVKGRGKVRITNLRDSQVRSETAIDIGVAIASEPDKVTLEVPPGGYIRLSLVSTQAQLRIGEWRHQLNPEPHGVHVQSDQAGRVTITPGRQRQNGQAAMLPVLR